MSEHGVVIEIVGGPNDGDLHVMRQSPFTLGAEARCDARVRYERLLYEDAMLTFELAGSKLNVSGAVDFEYEGSKTRSAEGVGVGDVLRVGATELMVNHIEAVKAKAEAAKKQETVDGQVKCSWPECGELNDAGRTWCWNCGRDL
jgi:hypothetical protein